MMELCGLLSIPLLLSFPSPIWHGVVAPERVLSMDQMVFKLYLC